MRSLRPYRFRTRSRTSPYHGQRPGWNVLAVVGALMKTLLSERYAPITSSFGFLRVSLDEAVDALAGWRHSLVDGMVSVEDAGPFPECLRRLEPLIGGARPRELLVEASDGWTAYFDCLLRGTDAVSAVGYLARTIPCQGLAVCAIPHTTGKPGLKHGQFGGYSLRCSGRCARSS